MRPLRSVSFDEWGRRCCVRTPGACAYMLRAHACCVSTLRARALIHSFSLGKTRVSALRTQRAPRTGTVGSQWAHATASGLPPRTGTDRPQWAHATASGLSRPYRVGRPELHSGSLIPPDPLRARGPNQSIGCLKIFFTKFFFSFGRPNQSIAKTKFN